MGLITYTKVTEESLASIKENMSLPVPDFRALREDEIPEFIIRHPAKPELLLLGEQVGNPIKIAQAAYALDPQLSIIILNDEASHQKIKQALLFTPFIGNSVTCISNKLPQGLAAVIENAISRTRQRRSYARLQGTPVSIAPNVHIYENIKSDFLDKFLEGAPIGAVLMSQQGVVLAMNQYAAEILLKTEKETLGNSFAALFPGQLQHDINNFILTGFQQDSTRTFERNLEEKVQYLEIRIASIATNKKNPYKIGIISDRTEKILGQQQIERQLKELAQSNESLKRANTDLDAFVYTASHDLKAPISNIEGLISLLEKKLDQTSHAEARPIIGMIKTCIDRFQETIKDLSDVAFIQKNHETEESIIDVKAIIEEVKLMIRGMIESTDAQVILEAENCSHIRFSRTNFRSIIYNLLSNAIKYHSPERTPIIRIGLKKTDGEVLLSVEDNGLGFPADKKEKIFTMFKRLHTHVEGTGIGLFIVKRIIDNTGSRIDVESNPGHGTTFRIYLKQE